MTTTHGCVLGQSTCDDNHYYLEYLGLLLRLCACAGTCDDHHCCVAMVTILCVRRILVASTWTRILVASTCAEHLWAVICEDSAYCASRRLLVASTY